jgi:acetyl-CoA carboxylase carboxyl transferase subunit beta
MGAVVGEKFTRAIERATREQFPLVLFFSTSGARMQEGIFALMQMAKVSAALARYHNAGAGPFVSVMTHPTIGGASLAYLGDVILAEPGAHVGFASPRVIRQLTGKSLPEGSQTSEFFLRHGLIDRIVPRRELRGTISQVLEYLAPGDALDPRGRVAAATAPERPSSLVTSNGRHPGSTRGRNR